ncbi:hypothetical protein ABOM_003431 [Aspergillus bombycis]|uniref:Uncharacterized protein n=1 Tax=Aspergillus bombycis TaxID=109264 RepID=A0A1F8A9L1_9EURO|nr:hypothetical protein ABOM_003431 [Aspergillus bombycis]OGM48414.1 hypothetical protein ABOM_003431 [Aspergillus bombycis]
MTIQAVAVYIEPVPTERFKLSQYASCASFISAFARTVEFSMFPKGEGTLVHVSTIRRLGQIATAMTRGVVCMLIPRRPDVYWNGRPVDAELTVSILNRLSFAWAEPLLKYVSINRSLEFDNLPQLAHSKRAEYLLSRLTVARASRRKLSEALATIHIRSFIQQVVLTVVSSALSVGPQVALYEILRCLEVRGLDPSASWRSWQWVGILGASTTLLTALQSWVQWLNNAEVCIPMVGEILTAIYAKALRTKSIRHLPSDLGVGKRDKDADQKKSGDSPHSTINLAAVDSERIIDFAGYTYLVPSALLRLLFPTYS